MTSPVPPPLIAWTLRWVHNAHQGREFTPEEISQIADHYRRGIDAWESAAAICEGRTL